MLTLSLTLSITTFAITLGTGAEPIVVAFTPAVEELRTHTRAVVVVVACEMVIARALIHGHEAVFCEEILDPWNNSVASLRA